LLGPEIIAALTKNNELEVNYLMLNKKQSNSIPPKMKINILLFGVLTEITGETHLQVEAEKITDLNELHTYLVNQYPGLGQKTFQYAVNQAISSAGQPVYAGDEIALLPPFSGG
jgi:molybdopterin synthase sulfur carrier subunit